MRNGVSRDSFAQWLMGLWLVWKSLCDEKHKKRKCHWLDLKRECEVYINGFQMARQQAAIQARLLPPEGSIKWTSPMRGRYRLDVNYAVNEMRGQGGVGAIVRDERDRIVFALAKPIPKSVTTLHGELKALIHGIRQCVEQNLSPVEVYTDSMLAVIVVEEEDEARSVLGEDMFDFFEAVKKLNVMSVSHVRREANRAAHELASLAKNIDSTLVWRDSWPSWLLDIVHVDST